MPNVFAGVDDLIDAALCVTAIGTSSPHYRHKKAALHLTSRPASFDTLKLFNQILRRIRANLDAPDTRWRMKGGSKENWRWEKKLDLKSRQSVDEKTVEKLVALHCGEDWVNQVPTASGLMNGTGERHCNIDLVRKTDEHCYEFIELKRDDSEPLFAAFELVKYSLLFLVSVERRKEFR